MDTDGKTNTIDKRLAGFAEGSVPFAEGSVPFAEGSVPFAEGTCTGALSGNLCVKHAFIFFCQKIDFQTNTTIKKIQ